MDYINMFMIILLATFTAFLVLSQRKKHKKSSIVSVMLIVIVLIGMSIYDYLGTKINDSLLIRSEYSGPIIIDVKNYTIKYAYLFLSAFS